jgi:hypothetical protein
VYVPARERPDQYRGWGVVEVFCVAAVILAVVALFAWFATHGGGGVLFQG